MLLGNLEFYELRRKIHQLTVELNHIEYTDRNNFLYKNQVSFSTGIFFKVVPFFCCNIV